MRQGSSRCMFDGTLHYSSPAGRANSTRIAPTIRLLE
jgi:hypothetical protein